MSIDNMKISLTGIANALMIALMKVYIQDKEILSIDDRDRIPERRLSYLEDHQVLEAVIIRWAQLWQQDHVTVVINGLFRIEVRGNQTKEYDLSQTRGREQFAKQLMQVANQYTAQQWTFSMNYMPDNYLIALCLQKHEQETLGWLKTGLHIKRVFDNAHEVESDGDIVLIGSGTRESINM